MTVVDGLTTFYNGIEEDIPLNKERRRSRYANYTRVVRLVPQYKASLFNESEDVTLNRLKYVDIIFNIYTIRSEFTLYLPHSVCYTLDLSTLVPHPHRLTYIVH